MEQRPSLRERSKARRRAAIERAALRLFGERGFDATTVADVAEAAEVSARTVTLYFPTKVELALSNSNASAARMTAALKTADEATPTLDIIEQWLQVEVETSDEEIIALKAAMFAANPSLSAMGSGQIRESMRIGSERLAREHKIDTDHPMIWIVRGAITGVITEYMAALARGAISKESHQMALRFLRAGTVAISGHRHKRSPPDVP